MMERKIAVSKAQAGVLADRRTILGMAGGLAVAPTLARAAPPQQEEIWFVRHAQSVINLPPDERPTPAKDDDGRDDGVKYPLTRLGMKQARALGERLAGTCPSAIYASTRVRAIQTADAIGFSAGCEINLALALVEVSFGSQRGANRKVTELSVQDILRGWLMERRMDLRAPGGESYTDVRDRAVPFISQAIRNDVKAGKPLIFVTHGALIALVAPLIFKNIAPTFCIINLLSATDVVRGVRLKSGDMMCVDCAGTIPPVHG
jgi:probable phosphoglycerate mutase